MARDVLRSPFAPIRPALRLWDRVPIRVQGRITVGLPLLAVIVSACLALVGNAQRVAIENDIQRRFETNAALGELTSSMVNAETGMRGYLLTGQVEFLEPYDRAVRGLGPALDRLQGLIGADTDALPDQAGRLRDLRGVTTAQMDDLRFQRDVVAPGRGVVPDAELRGHLVLGKTLMDRIRGEVAAMQADEGRLLDRRLADIDDIRVRDYVSVAVALVAAILTRFVAWFLFRRGVLRRVERLTAALRDRREGRASTLAPPTKRDQMAELEREVHRLDAPAPP